MTSAPATGLVGRFTVRSATKERAAQFGDLNADSLDRVAIGRGAYLVIRRIAVGAASAHERDMAVADEVAGAARSAARPHRGHLPRDAAAVLFSDQAELTATLMLDIARGTAVERWWWRYLEVDVPPRVAEALLRNVIAAPAALDCLDTWGVAGEVLSAMTGPEAESVADALRQAHLDPTTGRNAGRPSVATQPRGRHDPARGPAAAGTTDPEVRSPGHHQLARIRRIIATTRSIPSANSRPAAGETRREAIDRPPSTADHPGRRDDDSTGRSAERSRSVTPPIQDDDGEASRDVIHRPTHPHRTVVLNPGARTSHMPEPPMRPEARPYPGGPHVRAPAAAPPPETELPQAPEPAPSSPEPSTRTATPGGFPTRWAGVFYLVGALEAVEPPEPFPWGHERWALLTAIAHRLTDDRSDPIWPFLLELAAHTDSGELFPSPALTRRASAAHRMIDDTLELDDGQLEALVATPGIVQATTTHIDVQIDLSRISIVARVRGLDADPGWCPELGRVIRFHFEDER